MQPTTKPAKLRNKKLKSYKNPPPVAHQKLPSKPPEAPKTRLSALLTKLGVPPWVALVFVTVGILVTSISSLTNNVGDIGKFIKALTIAQTGLDPDNPDHVGCFKFKSIDSQKVVWEEGDDRPVHLTKASKFDFLYISEMTGDGVWFARKNDEIDGELPNLDAGRKHICAPDVNFCTMFPNEGKRTRIVEWETASVRPKNPTGASIMVHYHNCPTDKMAIKNPDIEKSWWPF